MPVIVKDRKLKMSEFDEIISPLVLDLSSFYNTVQDDIMTNVLGDDSLTPEQMIDRIERVLS